MKLKRRYTISVKNCIVISLFAVCISHVCFAEEEYTNPRSKEACLAYQASPFSKLSMDYFARFNRDPDAKASEKEMLLGQTWRIVLPADAKPLTELMADHLRDFLNQRMEMTVSIEKSSSELPTKDANDTISLIETGGGDPNIAESFTISVEAKKIIVRGKDLDGLRESVVKLVSIIGLRQAPILEIGTQIYKPRMAIRVGTVPWMGSYRDLVFMGYNAVILSGAESKGSFVAVGGYPFFSIYALSTSNAIPELSNLRNPAAFARLNQYAEGARKYNLKFYAYLSLKPIFEEDHPAFKAHPDIRGAHLYDDVYWYEKPGKYILCTESPLVHQYISETVKGLFKELPGLAGIGVIIGGEEFHHCFMRPYGVEKGHTNCKRCEALGHDVVVANLCNYMAQAAQEINPDAEILAWPYSASSVWSIDDPAQLGFISHLKPGVAIFADIVKDDTIDKPEGVKKWMWDYSIDLPGPGNLARQQLKACRDKGLRIHFKTESELAFEASKIPGLPCMDRWVARANAMASSGGDGAWVFPWFIPCFGASTAEIFNYFWWQPAPDSEKLLQQFAIRIAGQQAGPHLRNAWKYASEAIDYSPELGPYFTGVYYIGPAHPMCADPNAKLPEEFKTFVIPPTGDVPVFAKLYRKMADSLALAAMEIDEADKVAPKTNRLAYDAETSNIRWFSRTFRSTANYYESCVLRDKLLALAKKQDKSPQEITEAKTLYIQWRDVLLDEKKNSIEAIPVITADMRLDPYYGFDGDVSTGPFHGADMIREKLKLIDKEINVFLPALAQKLNINGENIVEKNNLIGERK